MTAVSKLLTMNTIWYSGVVIVLCVAAAYAAPNSLETSNARAEIQFQNQFDQPLHAQCHGPYGMYKVLSVHSNHHEDRVWSWQCRQVVYRGYPTCSWTGFVNNFDKPMFFKCAPNKYIGGVYSYHSNHNEDRRWRFLCCSAPNYITASCRTTGYVNEFDRPMNFQAGAGEVITGVLSYHSNSKEDRRFQFVVCKYQLQTRYRV